jgi:uncharacterized protein YabN with tetrapyrrole methylase and pyrophosphatase domain
MPSGSLTIVGTGIKLSQVSVEARACIGSADKVYFLVADVVTAAWITDLNPSAESLGSFYRRGKYRLTTYSEMVERLLSRVREGLDVCAVFYGHPGVFVLPSHEAIRRARLEGFQAKMLPAVSTEDCLFADLGIDPATSGCQSFEATNFLVYRRRFDPCSSLVLWQIGVTGELKFSRKRNMAGIRVLIDYLQGYYGPSHEVVIYEAAHFPGCDPIIQRVPLAQVPSTRFATGATLYVPPKPARPANAAMLARLGVPRARLSAKAFPQPMQR